MNLFTLQKQKELSCPMYLDTYFMNSNVVWSLAVVPPVTSIRGLLKKPEVKTQAHSIVQLTVPCFPVSFQSLLPANEKL